MSKAADYEARAEALITPIIESNGFELVDVEYVKEAGNYYLRAYIDKPGGITIDDCETVSRAFSDELDREDFIDEAYTLEISSPGLGRPLKKEKDFVRHRGDTVEVRLYKPLTAEMLTLPEVGNDDPATSRRLKREAGKLAGEKELTGILKDHDAQSVVIEITQDISCRISRADIALIRPSIDF
ncbi:MAG: ribosome maturation factor RimP [Lachnospiraceae bacterium]|nr:ribosome maturation factor RimP [Lachnospiraceae bacterium]